MWEDETRLWRICPGWRAAALAAAGNWVVSGLFISPAARLAWLPAVSSCADRTISWLTDVVTAHHSQLASAYWGDAGARQVLEPVSFRRPACTCLTPLICFPALAAAALWTSSTMESLCSCSLVCLKGTKTEYTERRKKHLAFRKGDWTNLLFIF